MICCSNAFKPRTLYDADIDLDIPDNRREEVLNYVREKYGQYHMAQIATFGTMAAKWFLEMQLECLVYRKVKQTAGQKQYPIN